AARGRRSCGRRPAAPDRRAPPAAARGRLQGQRGRAAAPRRRRAPRMLRDRRSHAPPPGRSGGGVPPQLPTLPSLPLRQTSLLQAERGGGLLRAGSSATAYRPFARSPPRLCGGDADVEAVGVLAGAGGVRE